MLRTVFALLAAVFLAATVCGCRREKKRPEKLQRKAIEMSLEELAKIDPEGKRGEVIRNMHTLKLVLEEFSTKAYNGYPTGPDISTGRVTEAVGYASTADQTQTVQGMLTAYKQFRNPYRPDLPVMCLSLRDPPEWSLELLGQVIWVPVAPRGAKAAGYKIYGAGPDSLYDVVVKSFGLE